MANRACKSSNSGGEPCQAPPLRDADFCLAHSPNHVNEVAEARRLGGLRRRRERTVSGAYDLDGVDTLAKVRRLLEIAVLDTLGLENSVARSRTLAYLAQVALKAFEFGEFEERLARIESAVNPGLNTRRR